LYDSAREAFLAGDLDWDADTINVTPVDTTDYIVDLSADDNYDVVPGAARVATAETLTGKSVTDGVADADDVTFPAISGDPIGAIVVWKQGGSEATSPLIAYIEIGPVTPNGSDLTVVWDEGPTKIFTI
jgi:hypothetical protein